MEQVRDRRLDHLCETIVEVRARMNADRGEEQGAIQSALERMHASGCTVYKHAGIELARVPGAEKLRVRLIRETGDAQVGGEQSPLGGDETLGEMPN